MIHQPGMQSVEKMDTPVGLWRGRCSCGWISQGVGSNAEALRSANEHCQTMNRREACECFEGVLLGQGRGYTFPPEHDAVIVRRCETCERYAGDLDAAVAYAERVGGSVYVIGNGWGRDGVLAFDADAWVADIGAQITWLDPEAATSAGWYIEPGATSDEH